MDLENSETDNQYLEYRNAALVQPLELVRLNYLDTGLFVDFPVYWDKTTRRTLLKCDLCGAFTVLGKKKSTLRIYNHRSKTKCVRKQNRNRVLKLRGGKSRVNVSLPQPGSSAMGPPPTIPSRSSIDSSTLPIPHNQYFETQCTTPQFLAPPSPLPQRSLNMFTFGAAAHSILSPPINPRTSNSFLTTSPPVTSPGRNTNKVSVMHLCPGVWVVWHPGSPWDTYTYQQHEIPTIWILLSMKEKQVLLRAGNCLHQLKSNTNLAQGNCSTCYALLKLDALLEFIRRAALPDAPPHTPWMYLNFVQTRRMLIKLTQKVKHFELEALNRKRALVRKDKKLDDYKRIIMLLSQHKIAGVSKILALNICKGSSPAVISKRLNKAIDGTYVPRGGWTQEEFDIAFLAKALGGARLLYVIQKAEGYLSETTLKRKRPIPELKTGRKPAQNPIIGQILMIDGVALEEVCRGKKLHGPIRTLATDGKATFRFLRFLLGLVEDLDRESDLGKLLYQLPGLNCVVGKHGLLTTCDPKHIIKCFATMIRSSLGILIGNTALHFEDFLIALRVMDKLSNKQARELLDPADKQNVPKAVNLLQTLKEQSVLMPDDASPTHLSRLKRVNLLAVILSKFLLPFINVNMTIATNKIARYLLPYYHSISIIKIIIFTVARYQVLDNSIKYYVILEGTDRLEGVFSNARTQDHARNFDILQLAHKLSVGAEINAIFERNPKLDRGHVRCNLSGARGVDHVNPKSWKGDVTVGKVDLLKEYLAARDEADSILRSYLEHNEEDIITDWDTIFANPKIDHLRPLGAYVGSRAADEASTGEETSGSAADDDDDKELIGALLNMSQRINSTEADLGNEPYHDTMLSDDANGPDASDNLNDSDGILNPAPSHLRKAYIEVEGGRKQHIDALVAEMLTAERARKSVTRTLRVKDVTVEESICRIEKLNIPDMSAEDMDIVKSGDLGAFLVRLPQNEVCLAVGEVLNFRGASSRKLVGSVKVDDLEVESGPNVLTVAVQVLDLAAKVAGQYIAWNWTKEYVQTKENQKGFITQTQCITRIPGFNFFPIAAGIDINAENQPIWSIQKSTGCIGRRLGITSPKC
ncbi:hypothetical protein B0H34DRAFT_799154 [Crassisporium funariophilum]|nr:hypothetical protein B0H34DRAFT_799154 [Crassisporium funariophilum]